MPGFFVLDFESSISYEEIKVPLKGKANKGKFKTVRTPGVHGPSWKDPKNDIYSIIYGTNPNKIKMIHSNKGFKRKLPWRVGQELLSCHTMIGTNLKFDLGYIWHDKYFQQWLKQGGKIWDCQVATYLLGGHRHQFPSLAEMQRNWLGAKTKLDSITKLFKRCIGADEIIARRHERKNWWKAYLYYGNEDGRTPMLIMQKQYALAKSLGMLPIIELYNQYLLALTMIEVNGIPVDIPAVESLYREFSLKVVEYLEDATKIAKDLWQDPRLPALNINSTNHSSVLLFGGNVKVIVKEDTGIIIKSGPNKGNSKFKNMERMVHVDGFGLETKFTRASAKDGFYSTDKAVIDNIYKGSNNDTAKEYCRLLKLSGTYKQKISTYLNAMLYKSVNGILRANYNNTETATSRLSASAPNLQNIPAHGQFGTSIPALLIAPKGWSCVSIDFSQLEVLCQAMLSKDKNLCRDIRDGIDFHTKRLCYVEPDYTYDQILQLAKVDKVGDWPDKRGKAKVISFQKAYGAAPESLSKLLELPLELVKEIFEKEDIEYPMVKEFDDRVAEEVKNSAVISKKSSYADKYTKGGKDSKGVPKRFIGNAELIPIRMADKKTYRFDKHEYRHVGFYKSPTGKRYAFSEFASDYKDERPEIFRYYKPTQMKNYGMQGCIHGDTKIMTDFGLHSIKYLCGKTNIKIWTDGGYSTANCVASGIKRQYIVELKDGTEIKCSPEHKFKYVNPSNLYEGWVTAETIQDKLREGKRVAVKLGQAIDYRNTFDFSLPQTKVMPGNFIYRSVHQIADPFILGEVLGRIASGGSVRRHKTISILIAEHEYNIKEYLLTNFAMLGHVTLAERQKKNQKLFSASINSSSLADELCGIKEGIPSQCWLNKDLMRGYLRGLFDGDGTVTPGLIVNLTFGKQVHKLEWAREVQLALRTFGIKSRLRHYPGIRTNVNITKGCVPLFRDKIGFINKIKQGKLLSCGIKRESRNIVYVKSVVDTKENIEMYDIVDSENKTFCANGVVTHNTAGDIQAITTVAMFQPLLKYPDKVKLVNEIHDSKWFLVKDEYLSSIVPQLCAIMCNTSQLLKQRFNMDIEFEFNVEAKCGTNFADMGVYNVRK